MARYVRVAAIPSGALSVGTDDCEAMLRAEIEHWKRNLDRVTCDHPDLIVTPECCDRPAGLTMAKRLEYYAVRGDRMREFFREQARTHHCNIAYSAVRSMPDGSYRNSIQMINRQGGIDGAYNKYLLVIEENTEGGIKYGKDCAAIETDIGRVCGAICFDLNFDEPLRLTAAQKPDITLFPSNYHGNIMQNLWAYMTRSYFISCIGTTQTANVINPVGEVMIESYSNPRFRHISHTINLDYKVAHFDHNMDKFQAMKAQYGELVEMRMPFGLGCALLTCNDDSRTMAQIVDEFEIELWDDYYARSAAARQAPGQIE